MSVTVTPFLRSVLLADAAAGGGAAILMIAGAPLLSPVLGLPVSLLVWAGIALLPIVITLVIAARRAEIPKLLLIDIIAINALWVAASVWLLLSGWVSPNWLGVAFIGAQALAVALLAELQFLGMRKAAA